MRFGGLGSSCIFFKQDGGPVQKGCLHAKHNIQEHTQSCLIICFFARTFWNIANNSKSFQYSYTVYGLGLSACLGRLGGVVYRIATLPQPLINP